MTFGFLRHGLRHCQNRRVRILIPEERDGCEIQGRHLPHVDRQPPRLGNPPWDAEFRVHRVDFDHQLDPLVDPFCGDLGVHRLVEVALVHLRGDRTGLARHVLRVDLVAVLVECHLDPRNVLVVGFVRREEHAQQRPLPTDQRHGKLPRLDRLGQVRFRQLRAAGGDARDVAGRHGMAADEIVGRGWMVPRFESGDLQPLRSGSVGRPHPRPRLIALVERRVSPGLDRPGIWTARSSVSSAASRPSARAGSEYRKVSKPASLRLRVPRGWPWEAPEPPFLAETRRAVSTCGCVRRR